MPSAPAATNAIDEEVAVEEARQIVLEQVRRHPGDVGAQNHEFAVRHVDDAHLAEDDRKTERHQHEHREQDQPGKTLHDEDRGEIANRIVAEHQEAPWKSSLSRSSSRELGALLLPACGEKVGMRGLMRFGAGSGSGCG